MAAQMSLARTGTKLFGWGLIAFSLPLLIAPRRTGWLGGITVPDESTGSLMRSVAAREVVFSAGMISAASHSPRLDRWLMMRTLIDGSDVIGIAIAFLRGGGNARLGGLGGVALLATICDLVLWRLARGEATADFGDD